MPRFGEKPEPKDQQPDRSALGDLSRNPEAAEELLRRDRLGRIAKAATAKKDDPRYKREMDLPSFDEGRLFDEINRMVCLAAVSLKEMAGLEKAIEKFLIKNGLYLSPEQRENESSPFFYQTFEVVDPDHPDDHSQYLVDVQKTTDTSADANVSFGTKFFVSVQRAKSD